MKRLIGMPRLVIVVGGALFMQGCATVALPAQQPRDLPALYRVDEGFYRGGQPSPTGLEQLHCMGIKTVISLRQPSKAMEEERRLVEQLGMRWLNIPMWFWWRPSDRQVHQFLELVTDPTSRPVFVHCRQGWNRVGVMVAIYRVAYQGWTPQRAYREARQRGLVWWNVLTRYVLFRETMREYLVTASSS